MPPPLHVKEGIITEKVFPVFSESFFWTCFGLVMYIWELMGVTEKFAFQMWKNNIDLLGFMRELLRVGIFTVIFFRKYAQPHFIVCIFTINMPTPPPTEGVGIFTVKMPFFSGKTAENVMGVYGFDCPAIFWDLECSHFLGVAEGVLVH